MLKKWCLAAFGAAICWLVVAWGPVPAFAATCAIPSGTIDHIQSKLAIVVALDNGGLFHPNRMWSAVVDRSGKVCSVISSDPDAWPNSRAIALAKANTANGLSNNLLAVSTANWYSAVQPGGSGQPGGPLFGLNNSNPFNPAFLTPAAPDPALGQYVGGMITFGGGVALYNSVGKIIGGLGVSGDTSCADHVIAYRMRRLSGAAKIPSGVGFNKTDNIDYLAEGEAPNGFKHPHCLPTDIAPNKI
jgi:uncharacterized protein GlcG (DUF336 family)